MTEGWRWGRRSLRPVSREGSFVSRVSYLREGQDMRERRDLSRRPPRSVALFARLPPVPRDTLHERRATNIVVRVQERLQETCS